MSRIFHWPASRKLTGRKATTAIAIHCSATREGQEFDATDIDKWHVGQKWVGIGYHYVIKLDGTIEEGRPVAAIGSGVYGHNATTIHICYIGGLGRAGQVMDTRTPEQRDAMAMLVRSLKAKYKLTVVKGHRDFSPDKDGDGVVEKHEWLKGCPSFDVIPWAKSL